MEPKSPEQLPTPIEYTPPTPTPERPAASPERAEPAPEHSQEQRQNAVPTAPAVQPAQLPTPVPMQPANDDQAAVQTDTPSVAADEDLIEKEWVDKAKKIITETRDDPHAREREVGKLQADYLKKRYGKELGNQT